MKTKVLKIESKNWEGEVPVFVAKTVEKASKNMKKFIKAQQDLPYSEYVCFKVGKQLYVRQPDDWWGEYEDTDVITIPHQAEGPVYEFDFDIVNNMRKAGLGHIVDAVDRFIDEEDLMSKLNLKE